MIVEIQLIPTGQKKKKGKKACGQHKYYSRRLNQTRNEKKRRASLKRFSQNKSACQGKPQVHHHRSNETLNQEKLATGTRPSSLLPTLLRAVFWKSGERSSFTRRWKSNTRSKWPSTFGMAALGGGLFTQVDFPLLPQISLGFLMRPSHLILTAPTVVCRLSTITPSNLQK